MRTGSYTGYGLISPGLETQKHEILLSYSPQISLHGVDRQKFTFYTWIAWVLTNKAVPWLRRFSSIPGGGRICTGTGFSPNNSAAHFSIIPPILHTHISFIYHWRCIILGTNRVISPFNTSTLHHPIFKFWWHHRLPLCTIGYAHIFGEFKFDTHTSWAVIWI